VAEVVVRRVASVVGEEVDLGVIDVVGNGQAAPVLFAVFYCTLC
jgi:hypothetical protein